MEEKLTIDRTDLTNIKDMLNESIGKNYPMVKVLKKFRVPIGYDEAYDIIISGKFYFILCTEKTIVTTGNNSFIYLDYCICDAVAGNNDNEVYVFINSNREMYKIYIDKFGNIKDEHIVTLPYKKYVQFYFNGYFIVKECNYSDFGNEKFYYTKDFVNYTEIPVDDKQQYQYIDTFNNTLYFIYEDYITYTNDITNPEMTRIDFIKWGEGREFQYDIFSDFEGRHIIFKDGNDRCIFETIDNNKFRCYNVESKLEKDRFDCFQAVYPIISKKPYNYRKYVFLGTRSTARNGEKHIEYRITKKVYITEDFKEFQDLETAIDEFIDIAYISNNLNSGCADRFAVLSNDGVVYLIGINDDDTDIALFGEKAISYERIFDILEETIYPEEKD